MDQKNKPQATGQPINFYGALAVSLLVAVAFLVALFLVGFLFSSVIGSGDEIGALLTILPCSVLFFALPILLASKYGWRTVVVTILFQSFFIPLFILAIAMITSSLTGTGVGDPYYYDSSPYRSIN